MEELRLILKGFLSEFLVTMSHHFLEFNVPIEETGTNFILILGSFTLKTAA